MRWSVDFILLNIEVWLSRPCSSTGCLILALNTILSRFRPAFQGKHAEADALYVRALGILSATVGDEHLDYATTLINGAGLLMAQV